jgi:hypothetical protein
VLSGEIASRSCSQVYRCEDCELHQTIQDEVDRQIAIQRENRKNMQTKLDSQAAMTQTTSRKDH